MQVSPCGCADPPPDRARLSCYMVKNLCHAATGRHASMGWAESFLDTLKENDVRLVTYVPDNVLTPLINGANADNYFISVGTTREDEAIGMVAGAWMAGLRGWHRQHQFRSLRRRSPAAEFLHARQHGAGGGEHARRGDPAAAASRDRAGRRR